MSTPVSYRASRTPGGGGTSLISFIAASDANAQTIAQSLATMFNLTICAYRNDNGAQFGPFNPGSQSSPGTVPCVSGVAWSPY